MSFHTPLQPGPGCGREDQTGQPDAANGRQIYLVRFLSSSETALCSYEQGTLESGREVIAISRYGKDLAKVLGPVDSSSAREAGAVLPIERLAGERDVAEYERNLSFEAKALESCRRKAESHGLTMKVLSAHLLPEENKLLFFFAAEGRVDFRELVRDLVSTYRMRIELRQIGVRDETRLLGGVGICGRVLCCNSFPSQLCSVSIKMAKEQNLSLGSTKVSGPCGRLMCCLSYEHGFYARERSRFPAPGTVVRDGERRCVVVDSNLVSSTVTVSIPEGGLATLGRDRFTHDRERDGWTVRFPPETEES